VAAPLRSVETTAAWEQRLKDVEQGSADAAAFYRDICALIGELIPKVEQGPAMSAEQVAAAKAVSPGRSGAGKRRGAGRQTAASQPSPLGTCPICKQGEIVETAKAFGCSRWRDGCGFTIWKTMSGKRLAKAEVKRLIEQGNTDPIEGFTSKAGKPFSARLRLDKAGKVGFDFERSSENGSGNDNGNADRADASRPPMANPPTPAVTATELATRPSDSARSGEPPASAQGLRDHPLQCPKCRQGQLIEGRQAFGCNRWRDGCDFVVPKQRDGHAVTDSELRALVQSFSNDQNTD
jgi:DNA topoisomerase III